MNEQSELRVTKPAEALFLLRIGRGGRLLRAKGRGLRADRACVAGRDNRDHDTDDDEDPGPTCKPWCGLREQRASHRWHGRSSHGRKKNEPKAESSRYFNAKV